MKIRLLAVGTRQPDWVGAGFSHYADRMPREMPLLLDEVPTGARSRKRSSKDARREEGERMMAKIGRDEWCVALDVAGPTVDTAGLAAKLERWRTNGRDVVLTVGGADGLDQRVTERADETLSLSALTFPHGMVRVITAETIYRAWTVLTNHPYHRA